jgi:hypothetical protein
MLRPQLFDGDHILLGGGRTIGVECTLPGSSFAWRKSVLTGSVERQHRRASSCGGVSSLGQRGRRALHFSGESNKGRGRTKGLGAYLTGSCGKAREELAMYTGSFVLYYLLYLML